METGRLAALRRLRFDRFEVTDGKAVVFPFLVEDDVQAFERGHAVARYSTFGCPIGWYGASIPRAAPPSHLSVAITRCRSVCASDLSPSTDTSSVPAGIAAARRKEAAHVS